MISSDLSEALKNQGEEKRATAQRKAQIILP